MRTLSYFLEAVAELDIALNLIIEHIPCFADWYPLNEEDDHIAVTVTCRQEDTTYVEKMLAPFV